MRGLFLVFALLTKLCQAQTVDDVKKQVTNATSFVVPSSPALELLPDKPDEVTHISTSQDVSTNILPLITNGTNLQQGLALDGRPFIYFGSMNLDKYRKSAFAQIKWRTVLSAATAGIPNSKDTWLSFGMKVPLIDKGDPRASKELVSKIEAAYARALGERPPPFPPHPDSIRARSKYASDKCQSLREEFIKSHWNALKIEIGGAYMFKAIDSKLDALYGNRMGVWVASGIPLGQNGQLLVNWKYSSVKADSVNQESSRSVLGAKVRFFSKSRKVGVSGEYTYISSGYSSSPDLNNSWPHYALLLELPMPKHDSYIGLVLGFDGQRKDGNDKPKIEFRYAVYTNRILKP